MRFVLLGVLLLVPTVSRAAIVISEVAWMGSAESANYEWIELQNTGSTDVDVSGWTLSDGMNLNIALTGTIPGNAYAVLERTSEASAPSTAFALYTGALVNTGATLSLTRADGGLEDQIAGGENWQNLGGDNVTKETAQYTAAGWVTGVPTPGAVNSGTRTIVDDNNEDDEDNNSQEEDNNASNTKVTKSASSGETVKLVLRDVSLQLAVTSQSVGYVNQEISFSVKPSGIGDVLIDSLQYDWNFGDGSTEHTKDAKHSFHYPGKYVVTVYGGYKRQEQVARHEITILPVTLSLTTNTAGDVQVNNDSPYEIDVSGYQVEGKEVFIFPKYSVILPNQTVTLPRERVGGAYVRLKDATGSLVTSGFALASQTVLESSAMEERVSPEPAAATIKHTSDAVWISPLLGSRYTAPTDGGVALATTSLSAPVVPMPQVTPSSGASSNRVPDSAWPYLGLIVVILLGLVGTARKATRNQID